MSWEAVMMLSLLAPEISEYEYESPLHTLERLRNLG
jgi:hypothetical protein